MTILTISLTLGETTVDLYRKGVDTVFRDGTDVWAQPRDDDEYRATAERLGYGSDTLRMCQDHELAHTVLAVLAGQPYSPTLWGVAHGHHWPYYHDEEAAVLAFQAYCLRLGAQIQNIAMSLIKSY
jgi:hypothetical protein